MRHFLFFFSSLFCIVVSFPVQAQSSFYITKGGLVRVKDSAHLTLKDISLVNDGTFIAEDGTVYFFEDSSDYPLEIAGRRTVSLNHVNVNLKRSELTLDRNVEIKGNLRFKRGKINLGGNTLDLSSQSGHLIDEDNENHIEGLGKVQTAKPLISGRNHPANLGLVIHSPDTHQTIDIIRKHQALQTPDGQSILRSYRIKKGKAKLKSSIFRLYFFDDELGGTDPNDLNVWQSRGNNWILIPPLQINRDSNFVEFKLSRRGTFNRITLAKKTMNRYAGGSFDSLANPIKVYPNPTSGSFWLDFGEETGDELTVNIYNTQGQMIESMPVSIGTPLIKLSLVSHPPGTYILSLRSHTQEIYNSSILKISE